MLLPGPVNYLQVQSSAERSFTSSRTGSAMTLNIVSLFSDRWELWYAQLKSVLFSCLYQAESKNNDLRSYSNSSLVFVSIHIEVFVSVVSELYTENFKEVKTNDLLVR